MDLLCILRLMRLKSVSPAIRQALFPPEWIEQPDLNIFVIVQYGRHSVIAGRIHIIQQQPDTNTPICCLQKTGCKKVACWVVVQKVVLCVYRSLGRRS